MRKMECKNCIQMSLHFTICYNVYCIISDSISFIYQYMSFEIQLPSIYPEIYHTSLSFDSKLENVSIILVNHELLIRINNNKDQQNFIGCKFHKIKMRVSSDD